MHLSRKLSTAKSFFFFPARCDEDFRVVTVSTERTRDERFLDRGWISLTQFQPWPPLPLLLVQRERERDIRVRNSSLLFHQHSWIFHNTHFCLTAARLPHLTALCLFNTLPANGEKGILWKCSVNQSVRTEQHGQLKAEWMLIYYDFFFF